MATNIRVKTVSVTCGRKINLGNYNSADLSVTLWVDIDETEDDLESVMKELWTMAKNNIRAQGASMRKKPEDENLPLGLPK